MTPSLVSPSLFVVKVSPSPLQKSKTSLQTVQSLGERFVKVSPSPLQKSKTSLPTVQSLEERFVKLSPSPKEQDQPADSASSHRPIPEREQLYFPNSPGQEKKKKNKKREKKPRNIYPLSPVTSVKKNSPSLRRKNIHFVPYTQTHTPPPPPRHYGVHSH